MERRLETIGTNETTQPMETNETMETIEIIATRECKPWKPSGQPLVRVPNR